MAEDEDEIEHSKLGVASVLIGIGIFISAAIVMLFNVKMEGDGEITKFESNFMFISVYYVFIFAPAAHLVGLILGIGGCLQNKRRKVLAIAGIITNLFFLFTHFGVRGYYSGALWR
jgi:hypothetical protein